MPFVLLLSCNLTETLISPPICSSFFALEIPNHLKQFSSVFSKLDFWIFIRAMSMPYPSGHTALEPTRRIVGYHLAASSGLCTAQILLIYINKFVCRQLPYVQEAPLPETLHIHCSWVVTRVVGTRRLVFPSGPQL